MCHSPGAADLDGLDSASLDPAPHLPSAHADLLSCAVDRVRDSRDGLSVTGDTDMPCNVMHGSEASTVLCVAAAHPFGYF